MDMTRYASAAFISVDDVQTRQRKKIKDVTMGNWDKPVLEFTDGTKLSANKTNVTRLIAAFGTDSRDWAGCTVDLSAGEADFQGGTTACVVVTPLVEEPKDAAGTPLKPAAKKAARKAAADGTSDFDDPVPFT